MIEVRTNELKPTLKQPRSRHDRAIMLALVLDLYYLSRIAARTKLMVLTDRPRVDLCSQDMDSLLFPDAQIVHCSTD